MAQGRPRRANIGAGVERMQIYFRGKGYDAKRKFSFIKNGKTQKVNKEQMTQYIYMQMAIECIFTQMSANAGLKIRTGHSRSHDKRIHSA